MKGFLAVFGREIEERRLFLPFGLLIGLVPLLLPLLPGLGFGGTAGELRMGAALVLGFAVAEALAVILGGTLLGRDLSERRLAFYFARPVAGWAIWAGKIGAAIGIALGTGLLVLLPCLLLGDLAPLFRQGATARPAAIALGAIPIALGFVLLAHAVGTMLRARSSWLLLDLVALAAVAAIVGRSGRSLLQANAVETLALTPLWLGGAAILALGVASAAQILVGRTDLLRGYHVLSRLLWSLLLVVSLGFAAFAHWVLDVSIDDMASVDDVIASPSGRFVALDGRALHRPGYTPSLLVDLQSGKSTLLAGTQWFSYWKSLTFSADGRRAVWLVREGTGRASRLNLVTLDLTHPGAAPRETPASIDASLRPTPVFALSPDGRLFSTIVDGSWLVEEVDTGRRLVSERLFDAFPSPTTQQLCFDGAQRVRFYQGDWASLANQGKGTYLFQSSEIAIVRGAHNHNLGGIDTLDGPASQLSPDCGRLLTLGRNPARLRLFDTSNGALIADIDRADRGTMAWFLADGRLVRTTEKADGSTAELAILDRSGAPTGPVFPLGARHVLVGGQPDPAHLVLTLYSDPVATGPGASSRVVILDLRDGRMRQVATDLSPAYDWSSQFWRPGPPVTSPRLYRTRAGDLVELDLESGRRRTLVRNDTPSGQSPAAASGGASRPASEKTRWQLRLR